MFVAVKTSHTHHKFSILVAVKTWDLVYYNVAPDPSQSKYSIKSSSLCIHWCRSRNSGTGHCHYTGLYFLKDNFQKNNGLNNGANVHDVTSPSCILVIPVQTATNFVFLSLCVCDVFHMYLILNYVRWLHYPVLSSASYCLVMQNACLRLPACNDRTDTL